jgi:hypothetical protein
VSRLVKVAEIAELLDVSRQRADQLTRSKGWPYPIERVAPFDLCKADAMKRVFERTSVITLDEAVEALDKPAYSLPQHPRLWRVELIEPWAGEQGRRLHDAGG